MLLVHWVALTYATRIVYQYFVRDTHVLNFKADVLLCLYASVYFYFTALFPQRLLLLGTMQGYLIMAPPAHGSMQSALKELAYATAWAAVVFVGSYIFFT
jgi:hypothetical protein